MPTVSSRGHGIACSNDGRRLAWSEPGRIVVVDLATRALVTELAIELEPPVELAFAGGSTVERLLVLQPRAGGTLLRVCAMPDGDVLGNARLRGESRVAALCGSKAILVAGETVTILDLADLRTATLPIRGPLQVVTALSDNQMLVGTRGKLEAWDLDERRPTHKIGLAITTDATFAGAVGSKFLWFASPVAPGTVRVHRANDGKQLAELQAGGTIRGIAADPNSATLVALVELSGRQQLVLLDLENTARRVLPYAGEVAAFCLTGSPTSGVAVNRDRGGQMWVSLTSDGPAQPLSIVDRGDGDDGNDVTETVDSVVSPDDVTVSTKPVGRGGSGVIATLPRGAAASKPAIAVPPVDSAVPTPIGDTGLAEKLKTWRNQLHTAMQSAPRVGVGGGVGSDGTRATGDEPMSRSRAELHAWGQAARNRSTTTPPPPPHGWRLNDLVARFRLDARSKTLVALLYSSWLDGEGKQGLPVAVLARALGNDEDAWIEALAQGRLGGMGWLQTEFGRTRLHPVVGRFLDEAPPRLPLITPAEDNPQPVAPPSGPAILALADGVDIDDQARELADWLGGQVATIDVAAIPDARRTRLLAERVLEARVLGALPMLVVGEITSVDLTLFDGPVLLAIRGAVPARWRQLPHWPPPPEA